MIKSQLVNMGYEVITSENAEEAISLFFEAHNTQNPFHIAILDLTIKEGMGDKESLIIFLATLEHAISSKAKAEIHVTGKGFPK